MMNQKLLSQVEGLGRVCRCPSCPDLHVSIGPVDIRISEEHLEGLVRLSRQAWEEVRREQVTQKPLDEMPMSWATHFWSLS